MTGPVSLADQLRWGAALDVAAPPTPRLVLAGMGGSAMAADAVSLLVAEAGVLAPVHRSYQLPDWANEGTLIAVSYSGNTEETVSAAAAAVSRGLRVAVVTSGGRLGALAADNEWPVVTVPAGLQPRAAVGYQAAAAARLAAAMGVVTGVRAALAAAAEAVDAADAEEVDTVAAITKALRDATAVVYGGTPPAALAARRWKTQINENAKAPAFWGELPEIDHNEIVGWTRPTGPAVAVFLRDGGEHERVARRAELTSRLIGGDITVAGEVWARGDGALARFFSLAAVGDAVSLALAAAAGIEAEPVDRIEELKRELGDAHGT